MYNKNMEDKFDNLSQEIDIVRRDVRAIETMVSFILMVGIVALYHFW